MNQAKEQWEFEDAPDTPVVTTAYVTAQGRPILYVSHERDEDGESTWQFHCPTEPFSMAVAQLVRLDTIVRLDETLVSLADLPIGWAATRRTPDSAWVRFKEDA